MSRLSAWCVMVCAALALGGHVAAQQAGAKGAPDAAAQVAASALLARADAAAEKRSDGDAAKLYIEYLSRFGSIAEPQSVDRLLQAAEREGWRQLAAVVACLRKLVNDHPGTPAAAAFWHRIDRTDALSAWRGGQTPEMVRPGRPVRVRVSSAARWQQMGTPEHEAKMLPKYALFRIPAAAYRAELAKLQDDRAQDVRGQHFAHHDLETLWRAVPLPPRAAEKSGRFLPRLLDSGVLTRTINARLVVADRGSKNRLCVRVGELSAIGLENAGASS